MCSVLCARWQSTSNSHDWCSLVSIRPCRVPCAAVARCSTCSISADQWAFLRALIENDGNEKVERARISRSDVPSPDESREAKGTKFVQISAHAPLHHLPSTWNVQSCERMRTMVAIMYSYFVGQRADTWPTLVHGNSRRSTTSQKICIEIFIKS